MALSQQVLWTEGLFLHPQHFQQQTRYLEGLAEFTRAQTMRFAWGFAALSLDRNNLRLGKLGLTHCRGIFPDGAPFDLPDSGSLPPVVDVPIDVKERLVYLAVPLRKAGIPAVDFEQSASPTRLIHSEIALADDTGLAARKETVMTGMLNVSIKLEGEQDLGDHACLAIARIKEVLPSGEVVLDESFLPPGLDIRASREMQGYLEEIAGRIGHLADALASRVLIPRRSGAGGLSEFLILQLLNRYASAFRHLESVAQAHPEELFHVMSCLYGELAAFVEPGKRPLETAPYRHELPQWPFENLRQRLRAAFGKLLQPQALQLEIREDAPGTSYGIRTAPIPGPRLAETGRFILAAKADMAPERLAMELPEKIKVGSSANITDLVRRNLRGIPVIPARTHPEEIPYHAGFTYFGLDPNHEFWRQIQETSALAFHISGDLPGLELEMWVINHEKD
uniref:Type VI secretion system protein ImpJ n=1 Tax=Candidatus Kentrum sp. DK TaxID=2126562 RepID=A0A450TJC8_9GAMM|nr:MAG: type VI secretion system protein ImpJ [Candidatus Kentron sp. DK]